MIYGKTKLRADRRQVVCVESVCLLSLRLLRPIKSRGSSRDRVRDMKVVPESRRMVDPRARASQEPPMLTFCPSLQGTLRTRFILKGRRSDLLL